MIHFLPPALLEDREPIRISLIGAGGTGSQLLTHLARIHATLLALDKQGLHVRVYDPDTVSEANLARQMFSPPDVGGNKAVVLTSRINRFFGLNWQAVPNYFEGERYAAPTNIYITCVDSARSRRAVYQDLKERGSPRSLDSRRPYYWLDTGNMADFGQVVLGTLTAVDQPPSQYATAKALPTVLDMFPDMHDETPDTPSCSLAEAISKQDLFINTAVATQAAALVWKMLQAGYTTSQGSFINLQTGKVNPIPVAGTSVPALRWLSQNQKM